MYTALASAQVYSEERTIESLHADLGKMTLKYKSYFDGAPGLVYPLLAAEL